MAVWIVIKLSLLSLGTIKNMVSIMRRPLLLWLSVRTILALAASNDWPLHQMDVKNAFLHGDLKERIYMKPPPRLFSSRTSNVCKLRRSLYGLKQAPRAWFDKFRTTLLQFSFKQSKYDTSPFL